ncbi:chloride channel protein [Baekduia soli]|uniref:Chloride channel protein n=1 Tax=Baekduia soli TaxID=496014 RepID=A0A5B8U0C1_9ACTN|nr:chloride channel protein [Baekduia soli]QEC46411.1 chloride channel protein [Baekduia soli]
MPDPSTRAELRDFSTSPAVVLHVLAAALVGAAVAVIALGLLDLISLLTHLLYSGQLSVRAVAPSTRHLGVASALIPVAGGLVVGLMARFGSERIRGHGIPEAIETILLRGSRMEPRLAVLKPLSSAISIGSGGPFGAEGPIIVTGGAVGSITGQLFHLTAAERRALLVAGAAGGMTAVFGTPLASVLLAVELLLFEWRPRSVVPAVAAAAAAAVVRSQLASAGLLPGIPLFPMASHTLQAQLGPAVLAGGLAVGVCGGALAWVMTRCVYAGEDLFARLPLHWSWWPALGGVVVGVGGLIDPRVLGVGYGTIGDELAGRLALGALAAVLVVKLVVWAVALGSNTSGGILAPLMMLGAAAGGLVGHVLPGAPVGTYALLGLAAAMAGVMRSPLTSIAFAIELTHDVNAVTALVLACGAAHLVSVLVLPRSILTEKIARRGYHVSREYAVDPLEALFVRDVMETDVTTVSPTALARDLYARLPEGSPARRQRLYPMTAGNDVLLGVIAFSDLMPARSAAGVSAADLARIPVVAHADETLRHVADRMAAEGHGALPVVEASDPQRLVGLVTQFDLLRAHERVLVEERRRAAPLHPRSLLGLRPRREPTA